MQVKTRFFTTLLSICTATSLCIGLSNQAYATEVEADISFCSDIDAIQVEIQNAIDNAIFGDVIKVVGSNNLGTVESTIELNIPFGYQILWLADLTANYNDARRYLIELTGEGTFELAGGSIVISDSYPCGALFAETDATEIIVSSGTITVSAEGGTAIFNKLGSTVITSGTISASGHEAVAVMSDAGFISVSGGVVRAEGDQSSALCTFTLGEASACIDISGGNISAEGEKATTLYIGCGLARIIGGSVSATGQGSRAIAIKLNGGAAVFLTGTVAGAVDILIGFGVIIEASVYNITPEHVGTKDDLTIAKIGALTDPDQSEWSEFDYFWESVDSTDGSSVNIALYNVRRDEGWIVPWGGWVTVNQPDDPPITHPDDPSTTPDTGDNTTLALVCAFVLTLAGVANIVIIKRSQQNK